MIINRSGILVLFALYAIVFTSTLDSMSSDSGNISNYIEVDTLKIPLYEQYKITSNYHLNQQVTNIFRWTTVGIVMGASVGGIIDATEQGYNFILSSVIGGVVGIGAGFLFGTIAHAPGEFSQKTYSPYSLHVQTRYSRHVVPQTVLISIIQDQLIFPAQCHLVRSLKMG